MDKQKIEEMAKDVKLAGQIAGDWLMEESRKLLQEKGRFKSTEHTKTLSQIVAEELAKMGYRKQDVIAEEILKKVYSYTLDDEIGMRWLLRELAKDYGVELK